MISAESKMGRVIAALAREGNPVTTPDGFGDLGGRAEMKESPCPDCGCPPDDAWGGDDCTNEDCPCYEGDEDGEYE